MLFAPADHIILDEDKFVEDCNVGFDFIENNCALLTFGIQATIPHTGYGYIEYNESVSDPFEKDNIFPVLNFVEKPDHNTALKYLHQGNYVWNSGIFLWHMKTISEEFQAYLPGWLEEFNKENIHNNIRKIYESIQSISIDYAILEKSKRIFVKKVNFGWSDLGSWGSLYDHLPQNEDSNAMIGNGILALLPSVYCWQLYGWSWAAACWIICAALLAAISWLAVFGKITSKFANFARAVVVLGAFAIIALTAAENCDLKTNCSAIFS
jgi:mannose-1-phosphate guanylyltransferase